MDAKKVKHVYKEVDKVIKSIKEILPEDYTPYQVKAIFDLYMSMYE